MDRPRKAIDRPLSMATSAICCTRWMWEAKQAAMIRLSLCSQNSSRSTTPTVDSDGVWPASSALVESDSRSRTPRRPISPMRARSVIRPSTGFWSSLKSPECRIVPAGVKMAVAKPWGTEWVTGMNWQSNGPIVRRSPSATGIRSVRDSIPASSIRLRARPSDRAEP